MVAIIKKIENNKCCQESGEIKNFIHSWWDCEEFEELNYIVHKFELRDLQLSRYIFL